MVRILKYFLTFQYQQRADEMSALAQQQPGFDSFNNQNAAQNSSGSNAAAGESNAAGADATFNAVAANASNNSGQFENMGYDQVLTSKLLVFKVQKCLDVMLILGSPRYIDSYGG